MTEWRGTHTHTETQGMREMEDEGIWMAPGCLAWAFLWTVVSFPEKRSSGKNVAFWGGWETSTSRYLESSWLYEPVAPGKNWARDTDLGAVSIQQQRRQWHPTPVLSPGKSHGQRSLVGCSPWVAKSRTHLSNSTFTFHFHALEKEMATHSSVLAWRIPGTGEPGGLPAMGAHRVGHDWRDLAAAAASNGGSQPWLQTGTTWWVLKWTYIRGPPQAIKYGPGCLLFFLSFPSASGSRWWEGSLACCSQWGHKESDATEQLNWTEAALMSTQNGKAWVRERREGVNS